MAVPEQKSNPFWWLAAGFFVLWVANVFIPVPVEMLHAGTLISTAVFLAIPILALYYAGRLNWSPLRAAITLVVCLAVVGALALFQTKVHGQLQTAVYSGIFQMARIGWPLALGVLVASLVKDKNLLLPIAIVLATVDILAVFAPAGTVKQGLQSPAIRPIFDTLAYQIPKFGTATPAAQMGPADPLFLGMFFYAIHKFGMRARETLLWMLPALLVYLLIVLFFGGERFFGIPLGALPALVPIGIVIVAVNWREFALTRQEKAMTATLGILCLSAIAAAFFLWK